MYKKQQKNIIKAAVRGKKLVGLSLFSLNLQTSGIRLCFVGGTHCDACHCL